MKYCKYSWHKHKTKILNIETEFNIGIQELKVLYFTVFVTYHTVRGKLENAAEIIH